MENNQFEDSFKNAFAGAEVSPSDQVWTNVELDLEKASGGKLKRNLLLFQLLAAASVAFAFGVGALYYLDQPVQQEFNTVGKQAAVAMNDPARKSPDQKILSEEVIEKDAAETSVHHPVKSKTYNAPKNSDENPSAGQSATAWTEYKITRSDLAAYVQTKKPVLMLPQPEEPVEPDAGMVLLARLKDEEKKYQAEEKKNTTTEKMWASVGFGAGSYKPNVQSSSVSLNAAGRSAGSSSESVAGASYSVGVSVGAKLSKRVIVQGGVSYLTQNADFTSTALSHQSAVLKEFVTPSNFDDTQVVNPYSVNSSLQFVSIPVQAGYLLIDRAFGVQLNGGIATDLFISSTLSPENDDYQKVTQSAGKNSPYRTVNFSGLLGTEFSYRIADHYRISVNPGLRYSLNSIYKEEVAAEITPVTFDVSLRFRYIFK